MSCLGRFFAILIVTLLAVSSLMMVESASAQTIPKPSVPEFTVTLIPSSYSVTTTNPYTGEVSVQEYQNNTIKITITNQKYTYANGSSFYVYLNVRTKGYFEQNWTELYHTVGLLPNADAFSHRNYKDYFAQYIAFTAEDSENSYSGLAQSNSQYTTISVSWPAPTGQVDFEVEAMVGHNSTFYDPTNNIVYDPLSGGTYRPAIVFDISSDWSNTKTISIPKGTYSTPNPSTTPLDTSNPTDTNSTDNSFASLLTSLALVAIAVSVLVVISLLLYVRHLKRSTAKPDNSVI